VPSSSVCDGLNVREPRRGPSRASGRKTFWKIGIYIRRVDGIGIDALHDSNVYVTAK
jgi:hypothetical protein